MQEFDWVKKRHACSLGDVFERLRLEVQSDVNIRNELRDTTEPEGHRYYGFGFKSSSRSFTAFAQGTPEVTKLHKSVLFTLEADHIAVTQDAAPHPLIVRIGLNDEARCVFKVEEKEYESWQLRKLVLDDLFFYSY